MIHAVGLKEASKLERLQQLFTSSTHEASAAMCCWTNNLITLTLDEEQLTMVVMNLEGELGGSLLLTFTQESGRRLAASLLHCEPGPGPEWTEMETSALAETGNILGCSYINAITRLINQPLSPSVPYFVQDFGASVLHGPAEPFMR